MAWDPDKYNTFKKVRFAPFFDLANQIQDLNPGLAVDIGCGTGEQTSILSERFPALQFLGIDSSPEMLAKAEVLKSKNLDFELRTTASLLGAGLRYDLLFSNAALQWSDAHVVLFPALLNLLNAGGQFAVQMPMQGENVLNQLLLSLASEEPYRTALEGWRRESPLLTIDEYAQILYDGGLRDINIMVKVYPIIASDENTLFDFIAGSALIPYIERLSPTLATDFSAAFRARIKSHFYRFPAFYAFKRLLLYGRKSK